MAQEPTITLTIQVGSQSHQIQLNFDLSQFTHRIIYGFLNDGALYEEDLCHLFFRLLAPGDVFIDVGAHIGFFTLLASRLVGPSGKVIAVEGEEVNFHRINNHKNLNDAANIMAVNAVVSEKEGPCRFFINSDNDGGHALWDPGAHPFNKISAQSPQPIEMPGVTLDSLTREHDLRRVRAIKIDTEGAELLVLRGGRGLLETSRNLFVACELNGFGLKQLGFSQEDLRSHMLDLGYETFAVSKNGTLPKLIPEGITITSESIQNILFARLESLKTHWPTEVI